MSEDRGVSRRHYLRLVLGQGAEIARERDRRALELDQEAALSAAGEPDPSAPEPAEGEAPPGERPEGRCRT